MRRLARFLLILVILIVFVAGAATGYVIYTTRRMLPQHGGTTSLAGLDGEVKVYRDSYGIPHIYATTPRDLFFVNGFIHAQDRWWNMEFNRHTALGRISELTGKNDNALSSDKFIRTVGWNRSAQADLAALSKETRDVLEAYSQGVNAYIAGKSGADLAVEYSVLGLRGINIPIEQWQPLHSIAWAKAMAYTLSGNFDTELTLARLYKELGQDYKTLIDTYVALPYPFDQRQTIVTADDLPIKPEAPKVALAPVVAPGTDFGDVQTTLVGNLDPTLGMSFIGSGIGSNNWVVSGKLTQSGKPLLANDPHLGIQMPSIWYQVGLHCVQVSAQCPYDVVGFSFPGVPGVIIGHNQRIAWGVTNVSGLDTQDLYIIKVDPSDDTKYEVDGKTESMTVVTETIKFGDSTPPQDIRVRITRFGPILTDSPTHAKRSEMPLALHWTATDRPYDLLGSVLAINRASDWNSFRAALTGWAVPAQNFIYADVEGNIGYQTPGLAPIRAKDHSGQTPVDGSTTKYDWKGYIPFEYLPRTYNPARGYVATANEAVVPMAYFDQLAEALGDRFGKDSNYLFAVYDMDFGYRGKRIVEMIKAKDKHTVETMAEIHGDNLDGSAPEILPFLLKIDFGSDVPKDVLDWLGKWDYQTNMESGPAALYEAFWGQLTKKLWADQLGSTPAGGSGTRWATRLLLDQPDNLWWDDVTTAGKKETRDDILRSALVDAYKGLVSQFGADFKAWKWGSLHQGVHVSNPLGASGISLIENFVNGGPVPVSGTNIAVNATGWSAATPYRVGGMPSMRMIVDLSNFDNSRWINATGESGHPTSGNYRDQIDLWRMIQYLPMRSDRAGIEKAASAILTLQPK